MDINSILALAGFLFGTGGIVYGIFYFRENKQLKKTEVKTAQYQAETTFVENLTKAADFYREIIELKDTQIKEIEEFHNSRYKRIAETIESYKWQVTEYQKESMGNKSQLRDISKKVQLLEKKINDDKPFICHDLKCQLRQPAQ